MIDPFSVAVLGLVPGAIDILNVATLGFYPTEVIITPVVSSGGGGWVPVSTGKPDRYKVMIRIFVNGSWLERSYIVDDLQARVTAKLYGIERFDNTAVMVSVDGVQVKPVIPEVRIR